MSVSVKGTEAVFHIRWIPKYTFMERVLHWAHTATYIPLAVTGFMLYNPWLTPLIQGEAGQTIRLVHRIMAIAFCAIPIIYTVSEPRRLIMHLREFFKFDKDDILWLKAAIPYYLLGHEVEMPPQPRFNTGERLNAVIMVLGFGLFGVTGFIMWFGKGVIPPWLFRTTVIVHDLTMIVTLCMFVVHFFLAVAHPLMWAGLVSMRFGVTSAAYAAKHHAKWYYGEKRARQLYEEAKAKATSETGH